jgi:hypothetical protein
MDEKDPTQTTEQGHEIPVPKRSAWDRLFRKAPHAERVTGEVATARNPNEAEFWDGESPTP